MPVEIRLKEYSEDISYNYDKKILINGLNDKIEEHLNNIVDQCLKSLTTTNINEFSIYSGYSGVCLALIKFSNYFRYMNKQESINRINEAIYHKLYDFFLHYSIKTEPYCSFLNASVGPLSLLSLHHFNLKNYDEIFAINNYITLSDRVNISQFSNCDLLSGVSGYLHALLFVCHTTNRKFINVKHIENTILTILNSINIKKIQVKTFDLSTAKGLTGILYCILDPICAKSDIISKFSNEIEKAIISVLEYFKTSVKCIDWYSGLVGPIFLAIRANRAFHKDIYLKYAHELADLIWKSPLSDKISLSNGLSGCGYAFLALYIYTDDLKYLHYAVEYGRYIFHKYEKELSQLTPNLFEGNIGTWCYLVDLCIPKKSYFPGFQIYQDIPLDFKFLF